MMKLRECSISHVDTFEGGVYVSEKVFLKHVINLIHTKSSLRPRQNFSDCFNFCFDILKFTNLSHRYKKLSSIKIFTFHNVFTALKWLGRAQISVSNLSRRNVPKPTKLKDQLKSETVKCSIRKQKW